MKLRRFLSCIMALLLVCGLPLSALAAEYNIANGSIEISASKDKQTVTQNGNTVDDDSPVITGTTTKNTLTIKAEETATANVTLSGVNIDVGGTGDYDIYKPGEAAVRITGEGNVTMELDGENTVQSGVHRAGVEKNDADSSGKLTITDATGTDGSLKATGGGGGSGIGGGNGGSGSNITITGSAEVTAQGGTGGAGIGGGDLGSGSDITITGSAEVTANGGMGGSGIGGGSRSSGNGITISGSAQVEATGGLYASGIGGGYNYIGEGTNSGKGTGSNITVSGDAQVKAQGGNYDYSNGSNKTQGAGAAIGNGGHDEKGDNPVDAKGEDAVVTTDAPQEGKTYGLYVGELKEGWVATYEPGENMDTEKPGSLTYQDGIKVPGAVPVPRKEPTCTDPGHEAGYEINGVLVAVTISAKGHNVPNGTPNNDATCVKLGTMTGYCTNCKTTVTVTDPNSTLKDHTFTTYTPDPNNLATCTQAGTKTAVCDVCKNATDTLPDPAKGHNVPNGTPNGDATCVKLGTMTGYCTNCKKTVTVPDPNYAPHTFTTYTPDPDNLATCTQAGTKTAVCDVCGKAAKTVTDPAKGHSFTNYVYNNNAQCGKNGTETAICDRDGCQATHTRTKENSALTHKFTNYIPDGNATCTKDGTKTAKCGNGCGKTHTVTDVGSALGHSFTDYISNNDATCTKDGTKTAKCGNGCGKTHTVTDVGSALGHSFTHYISNNDATCTKDGTKTAECDNGCGETHTVTDVGSALGHSFSDYISNKNATYTEDGTKTAKCDHPDCDETDTIPDPGTRLPCYQVKGKDGKAIPHQNVRKDGVLTITVDADFAILTGTLGGINALKAQGIDTIVFVTKAASSTFALSDLLEQGSIGDSYKLTHDCETVSFTLGKKETDVTGILAKP